MSRTRPTVADVRASSMPSGHEPIVTVFDRGGAEIVDRLLSDRGGVPCDQGIADARIDEVVRVADATAMGRYAETVTTIDEIEAAFERVHAIDRTAVIALRTDASSWTEGGALRDVREVSRRADALAAVAEHDAGTADRGEGR